LCEQIDSLHILAIIRLKRLEHHSSGAIVRSIERHKSQNIGWLRAAVLGADDGLISTASLVVGVAASGASSSTILVAGLAGLVAGAMSMAAGEYVSVSSQADTERADLAREKQELATDLPGERAELAAIYVTRGLTPALAGEVATQLMAKDALVAHARDELGFSELSAARPVQAAIASAISFGCGAVIPVVLAAVLPRAQVSLWITASAVLLLAALGALAAQAGGASRWRGALRVMIGGTLAMGASALVGLLFGTKVG
jgi:VIT1/CCC1 family predicted Fe2+/Mn2+ transporter